MTEAVLEVQQLETRALTLPEQARAIIITDQQSFEVAGQKMLDVAALRKEIVAYHKPLKEKAHETHRAICQAEAGMLEPVERAEKILKSGIAAWVTEQRRLEEEARRAEALRAQQEAERQRVLAVIEAQKAQAKADEERLKLALQAEKAGASAENITAILEQPAIITQEEVAAILQDPIVITPRPIQPTYQAVKGISTRDNWKFEITNAALIPREYLVPDTQKIGGVVRAMKSSANIPGIRVYNEPTAVGRTS